MQKIVVTLLLIGYCSSGIWAQSVNAPLNADYYHLIDRLEIQEGELSKAFHSSWKPYQRKQITQHVDSVSSKTDIATFNNTYLLRDSWEWSDVDNESKKPFLKHFYKVKSDLFHVKTEDFDLHVNPVLFLSGGTETNGSVNTWINTRGAEIRGMIDKKLGFYSFLGENQMVLPSYVRSRVARNIAVPGEGFWKGYGDNGYDFFTARGYLSYQATKHLNLQFGHDRFKIGNGYRSLILSDNSPSYLFLKMNAQVWKINYNFMVNQMTADVTGNLSGLTGNDRYPHKYSAVHHLSINIGKKVNIGVFESVIFATDSVGNSGDFDLNYMNPIIFFRALEQQNGSPDNVLIGMDVKWLVVPGFSVYGQLVFDEFLLENLREGNGWWGNKFGIQLGGEYVNAFGVDHLDLQGEINLVRPYTYSHGSPYGSYSHYRQSLAHPLGANFTEMVGLVRYQPFKRLYTTAKLVLAKYGTDPSGQNFGGNILLNNVTREANFGNEIGQGIANDLMFANLDLTYMLRHNVFIDLSHIYRNVSIENGEDFSTNFTSVALRWNIPKRLNEY